MAVSTTQASSYGSSLRGNDQGWWVTTPRFSVRERPNAAHGRGRPYRGFMGYIPSGDTYPAAPPQCMSIRKLVYSYLTTATATQRYPDTGYFWKDWTGSE